METNSAPKEKKKLNIRAIIALVIALAVAILVQYYASKPKTPTLDKQLVEVANEVNKSCPITVDAETQLDNVIVLPNRTFQYNYTLVNLDKNSIDTELLEEFEEYLQSDILNTLKTNPDVEFFRENDVTISYNYKDRNNVHILKLVFTPEQYK